MHRYLYMIILLSIPLFSSGEEISHDKWVTMPRDHYRLFTAFVCSFDGADDSDGDGDMEGNDRFGQPEWVAYEIRATKNIGKFKRPKWTTDKELFLEGVAPNDNTYKHSGYDRGHLCMKHIAARMGEQSDKETHTMLNACPQIHRFNAGIWLALEKQTADWADEKGVIWVICGPVWSREIETEWIGDDDEMKIPVPHKFFKIVVWEDQTKPTVQAWLFPHKEITKVEGEYDFEAYKVSVDTIEDETGIDFLTALPDDTEEEIEKEID